MRFLTDVSEHVTFRCIFIRVAVIAAWSEHVEINSFRRLRWFSQKEAICWTFALCEMTERPLPFMEWNAHGNPLFLHRFATHPTAGPAPEPKKRGPNAKRPPETEVKQTNGFCLKRSRCLLFPLRKARPVSSEWYSHGNGHSRKGSVAKIRSHWCHAAKTTAAWQVFLSMRNS